MSTTASRAYDQMLSNLRTIQEAVKLIRLDVVSNRYSVRVKNAILGARQAWIIVKATGDDP